jgi:hypothetical protein
MVVFEIGAIGGPQPLRLQVVEENWTTFPEPLWLECALVSDEKQVVGPAFGARMLARCLTSAQLETRQGLEVATNLRMRIAARIDSGVDADLYGKVVSRGPAEERFVVRFTSVPSDVSWRAGHDANGMAVTVDPS